MSAAHYQTIELNEISTEELHHNYEYGTVFKVERLYDLNGGHFTVFFTRRQGKIVCSTNFLNIAAETKNFRINKFCAAVMSQELIHVIWYPFFSTYLKDIYRLKPFREVTQKIYRRIPEYRPAYFKFKKDLTEFIHLTARNMIECVRHYENKYPDHKHIVAVGGLDARFILAIPKKRPENWIVYSLPPDASSVAEFVRVNKYTYECWFPEWPSPDIESREDYVRKMLVTQCFIDPIHLRESIVLKKYLKPGEKYVYWAGDIGDCLTTVQPEYHRWPLSFLYYAGMSRRATAYQGFSTVYMLGTMGIPYVPFYHFPKMWQEVFLKYSPAMIKHDTRMEILAELDKILGQNTINIKGPGSPKPALRYPINRGQLMLKAIELVKTAALRGETIDLAEQAALLSRE